MATAFLAAPPAGPTLLREETSVERRQRRVVIAFVLMAFIPLPTNSAIVVWTLATGFAIVVAVGGANGRARFMTGLTIFIAVVAAITVLRGLLLGIELQGISRDALDAVRFAPAAVVAFSLARGGRRIDLTPALAVVCILDAAISVGEFLVPGPFRLIYAAHGTEHHWSGALMLTSRAAGLYGSPGEHGSALALFGILLLFRLTRQPRPLLVVGFAAAVTAVMMSQSQTSFMAFGLGVTMVATWTAIRLRRTPTVRAVRWLILLTALLGPLLVALAIQRLRYLTWLFTAGASRSSYEIREEMWTEISERWDDSATSVLLGGGRSWLGPELTSVVDSDVRFVLYVYGVVGFVALITAFVAWVRAARIFRPEGVVIGAMAFVSSWANSFIADARLMTVAIVLLVFTPLAAARSDDFAESSRLGPGHRPMRAGTLSRS